MTRSDYRNLYRDEEPGCSCRVCFRALSSMKSQPSLYSAPAFGYRNLDRDEETNCSCRICFRAHASASLQPFVYGDAIKRAPSMSYDLWTTPRGDIGSNYRDSRTHSSTPAHSAFVPRKNYGTGARIPLTVTVYADASLDGFGFWSPQLLRAFYGDLPKMPLLNDINFMEYYAVANAILWASKKLERGDRLRVYTDSLNTVDKFNDGPAEEEYDELMDAVDDLVEEAGIRLSVWHIPGKKNFIADCLSRPDHDLEYIRDKEPKLQISFYNVSKRLERCASHY